MRLSLDRDFHRFGNASPENNIRNFPMFQEIIPSFAPGEELFTMLAQGHELNDFTPVKFSVLAKYEFAGRVYEYVHGINLGAYMQTSQDRSELLDEAKKISDAVEAIARK
jgi:hypothetical protein